LDTVNRLFDNEFESVGFGVPRSVNVREVLDEEVRSLLLELGAVVRSAGSKDTGTRGFTRSDTGWSIFDDEGCGSVLDRRIVISEATHIRRERRYSRRLQGGTGQGRAFLG